MMLRLGRGFLCVLRPCRRVEDPITEVVFVDSPFCDPVAECGRAIASRSKHRSLSVEIKAFAGTTKVII